MFKKIVALTLLVLVVLCIGKGWHWAKDGFHILRVGTAFPANREFSKPASLEANLALDQPFHFLGRGRQCYVFASRDGKYVLKLPRLNMFDLPFWVKACRFSCLDGYRKELSERRSVREKFTLNSFQIAFDELQDDTGVLYLHLYQTEDLKQTIVVRDCLGCKYRLDLDRTPFILQEKKALMMPAFERSLKTGDVKGTQEILEAFLIVIENRARKGIFNKDSSFLPNFGYDGKKVVQIDIGSFYRKPGRGPEAFQDSFRETARHVHEWLARTDPEMMNWFDQRVEEKCSAY